MFDRPSFAGSTNPMKDEKTKPAKRFSIVGMFQRPSLTGNMNPMQDMSHEIAKRPKASMSPSRPVSEGVTPSPFFNPDASRSIRRSNKQFDKAEADNNI
jgi:hypothetical protein